MYTRDLERLVREMLRTGTDIEYIKYYLMEEFQIDQKTIDVVMEKVGLAGQEGNPMGTQARPSTPSKFRG